MTRSKILVTGANGHLGLALLQLLGPSTAISATRSGQSPIPGFVHVQLANDGAPPVEVLAGCSAVINAAGNVTGDEATLEAANIRLPQVIARAAKAAGVEKMVQVSSFSVFGDVELIDADTPEHPINAYGRSKAAGDKGLLACAGDSFAVECLRLPFMFSAAKPGLLSPLLKLADTVRFLPTAKGQAFGRSMITYADAATTLVDCATGKGSGKLMAADPQLFDYALLKRVLAEEAGRDIGLLALPGLFVKAVGMLHPATRRRLFQSNILDPKANRAGSQPLGLESELRALVKQRYKPLSGEKP